MNNSELLKVAIAAIEYIDAIPKEMADKFPVMPGFSRDWANEVIAANKTELQWHDYLAISEQETVDESIRNLLEDDTEDNAVCMVRDIIEAARNYEPE